VELLPLFSKQLVADTIILNGVYLNLTVKKDGSKNWDDLAALADKDKGAKAKERREDAGVMPGKLNINGIKITDAQLILDDQKKGTYLAVENLTMQTGHLAIGEPIDLEVSLDLKEKKTDKPHHIELAGTIEVDTEKQTLKISNLELELDDLQINGHVEGSSILSEPKFKGQIKVSEFIPRDVLQGLGISVPKTQDPTVLGKAALETSFTSTTDSVKLSGLKMKLDDTSLLGQIAVNNFTSPAINFSLDIDSIDVDRYLPPVVAKSDAAGKSKQAGTSTGDEKLLPVETLRDLNLKGTLKIGKMKVSGLHSEQIEVGLTANKGNIRVYPAKAKLYQGSYSGDVRLDVRGKTPVLSMNEKLSGVQANPLFKDVANWDFIMGRADASAKLTSKGNTMNALKKGLNGSLQFSFKDGAIKGYNVGYMIRKTNASLSGQSAPKQETQETDFSEFRGTATVRNGVVHNNDLLVTSPLLRITGSGQADLVKEQLDYRVKTEIVASIQLQGGDPLEKLKGVQIPLRISGSFYDPKYNLELGKILEEKAKAKIKEKVEEKKQEFKQKLEDKLRDKLKDRFKGLF
jgi:AsmA protein